MTPAFAPGPQDNEFVYSADGRAYDFPTRCQKCDRECLDMADVLLADLRRAALEDTRPVELHARAGWLTRALRRLRRIG